MTRTHETVHVAKPPLPADRLGNATEFVMTDHVIERCQERGIGVMEIYSTIADPDRTTPGSPRGYYRGDLQVFADPDTRSIVTVTDRNADTRTTPRQPVNPLTQGRGTMPTKQTDRRATNGNTAALDEVWCLAKHHEEDVRIIEVTPALADKLLTLNTANRPQRPAWIQEHIDEIIEGRFKLLHEGICIDSDGKLQDGQHRLEAVRDSGQSVRMVVGVGFDPDNFQIIGTGGKRSYGDTLDAAGAEGGSKLGSIVRLVYLALQDDIRVRHKVTNQEVHDTYMQYQKLFDRAYVVSKALSREVFMVSSAAGAAYFLLRRVNSEKAVDEFFGDLRTGVGLDGDARQELRMHLFRSVRKGVGQVNRSPLFQLAITIKTWNAWAERRAVGNMSFRKDEALPRIMRFKAEK